MELEVSNLVIPVAPRNLSSQSRTMFFAWCYATIYAVTVIAAIAQVAA